MNPPSIAVCFQADGDLLEKIEVNLSSTFKYEINGATPRLRNYIDAWMSAYLNRKPIPFKGEMLKNATPFQEEVWESIQAIPFGQTLSYAQVAAHIGRPKAARAVGNACGRNNHLLIIPCHRVIHGNGTISGFAIDPQIKQELLTFEK